jgi:hypothetical protein
MTSLKSQLGFAAVLLTAFSGCSAESGLDDSMATQSVEGSSYYYLRCNSLGWNVDAKTRLVPGANAAVLELSYEVPEQAWFGSDGDDCVITETNARDGWGNEPKSYGIQHYNYRLIAPASGLVRPANEQQDDAHFKIQYAKPGRYRATFDTVARTFSVKAEGAAAPGEVAWTAAGYVQMDADGQLYGQTYGTEQTLARLDPKSGAQLWARKGDQLVSSMYATCGTRERLIGSSWVGKRAVVAVNPADGSTLWEQDIEGALAGNEVYPSVTCDPKLPFVMVRWGYTPTEYAAIRKSDGKVLWRRTAPSWASHPQVREDRVYFAYNDYETRSATLIAVDASTGVDLWTRHVEKLESYQANGDRLYATVNGSITLVDPSTGGDRWTRDLGEYAWPLFAADKLYLTEGSTRLTRLDTNSGDVLWTKDLTLPSGYQHASAIEGGNVMLWKSDGGATTLSLLDPANGDARWSREMGQAWPNVMADSSVSPPELYVTTRNTVERLRMADGTSLWSTVLPRVVTSGTFPGSIYGIQLKDDGSVYAQYGTQGYKFQPSGLVALRRTDGLLRWDYFANSPLSVLGSDAERIYASLLFNSGVVAVVK